jgi:hypothetical protein
VLTPVPSLDELARDPQRAANLPAHALRSLILRTATLQNLLLAALMNAEENEPSTAAAVPAAPEADRMLTPDEAAALCGLPRRYLLRATRGKPFRRDFSRKRIRFSEAGLRRWRDSRRP